MHFPLFALFLAALALAAPADTTGLAAPVVKTTTAVVTVTGSGTSTVVETSTASSNDEAITRETSITYTISSPDEGMSIIISEEEALSPTYPSWVSSVLATAIPTTWEEEMATNAAFFNSEVDAEASGILPDWYSTLPSDVRYILTSNAAVRASAEATFKYPTFVYLTATAASSSVTSFSSSTTDGTAGSGSTATASKTPTTSTSIGGAPVATGGFVMGIVGAAGILGLTLGL
jgi:hypothetical protein